MSSKKTKKMDFIIEELNKQLLTGKTPNVAGAETIAIRADDLRCLLEDHERLEKIVDSETGIGQTKTISEMAREYGIDVGTPQTHIPFGYQDLIAFGKLVAEHCIKMSHEVQDMEFDESAGFIDGAAEVSHAIGDWIKTT